MATYIVNISSFDESTLSPDRKYKVGFVVKGEGREKEVMASNFPLLTKTNICR